MKCDGLDGVVCLCIKSEEADWEELTEKKKELFL